MENWQNQSWGTFHFLSLHVRGVSRLSGRPKLGEPTSPAWTSNCRVGFNCCCCCCTQNRFFLRRVFHSPQIIFTEPHLWQACVNMRGFNCTRNLSSAQRWRVFSPRGGEKPEPLVFQGTEMFLTPLHTAPSFNCHRLSHRLSSNAIYRLSSSVLSTSMT